MKKNFILSAALLIAALLFSAGCSKNGPTEEKPVEDGTYYAENFYGFYYGDEFAPGVGNYWFYLSDKGFDNQEEFLPNGHYYLLDLYSPYEAATGLSKIPNGAYNFDKGNTSKAYTFSAEYSCYITTDENGNATEHAFESGTLIVTDNEMTLDIYIGGVQHKVKYNKSYTLIDDRETPNPPVGGGDGYSTLTSDYQLQFSQANAKMEYAGDWWNCGYDNWTIYIMSKENGILNGDTILLDFITAYTDNDGGIAGNYTGATTAAPMVFMAGSVTYNIPVGTWYFKYQNESIVAQAPIVSGTLTITYNNDGTYSIDINGYDDAETTNNISAFWKGDIVDQTSCSMTKNYVELPLRQRLGKRF